MASFVKIGSIYVNPEHVAAVLPRERGYESYVVMRNGDKYSVAETPNKIVEDLIGPPPFTAADL